MPNFPPRTSDRRSVHQDPILAIDPPAYLSDEVLGWRENGSRWNATDHGLAERIPRIIHQTWRTSTLPDRWQGISQDCRNMMPD